jgi:hypothetical protein
MQNEYNKLLDSHRLLKHKYKQLINKEKEKKKMEFSKLILSTVMLTYFIGLFFAIYAVNKILMDYPEYAIQALIALFGYIGTPISVSIGFYSWKAKNENTMKIECSGKQNNSEGADNNEN